jgi:hypothetical protein
MPFGAKFVSLRELQVSFMDSVLATGAPLANSIAHTAVMGLSIYRTNVRANFSDALQSTYPAVERLVGAPYFRQVARDFQRRWPSLSGDLTHVGEHFSDYLAELHHADEFHYLAEIARLEWLIQESLLAIEHGPLDLAKLAAVAPAAYDMLHFVLHPSLRLYVSRYPALRIWEANVGSDALPDRIDLDSGTDRLAIVRPQWQLKFHRLNPGEESLLRALGEDAPFTDALEGAVALDGDFDASRALQRFVAEGLIVDCR